MTAFRVVLSPLFPTITTVLSPILDVLDLAVFLVPAHLGVAYREGRAGIGGNSRTKKADAAQHPRVLRGVGLLVNEPPDTVGLPFI
jgi:hypothetical protein